MLKLQIKIKSTNFQILKIYAYFLKKILTKSKITFKCFFLPVTTQRITLLKSPHVNKKAREQFEIKTFSAIIQFNQNKIIFLQRLVINKPKSLQIQIKLLDSTGEDNLIG